MWRTDSLEKTLMLERLKAGERDDRRWDGWMASPTRWRWVWASSGSWWWTGKPGMLSHESIVVQSLSLIWLIATHGLQHARLPCPSPSPGACSNSCPLSRWCHPIISSSVISPFSCLRSFPASGSFLMSQFFASGGQSIGASASASVFLMNIQDWFPWGLTGFDLLAVQGTLKNLL